MDDMPPIEQLVWDEWNLDHIAKHGVTYEDVEAVIKGPAVARAIYKQRFLVVGPTPDGRVPAVVVGPDPHVAGSFCTFSARPASRQERRDYQQQRQTGGAAP